MKRIYLIRHGETESNLGGFYQSPEVPLSKKGHEGAKAVAERCVPLKLEVVYASPFTRAQETAEHIVQKIQKPLVTLEHAHEIMNPKRIWGTHFKSEEGKIYHDEREKNFSNPEWHSEEAENYFDVSKRVDTTILALEASIYTDIALVSHGNFLRYLIARILLGGDDPTYNIALFKNLSRMSNVAITEFTEEDGNWELITWNDHAHFAE